MCKWPPGIRINNYKKPENFIGENGLLKQLTKRLLEKAMQAEITDHLGYVKKASSRILNIRHQSGGSYTQPTPSNR